LDHTTKVIEIEGLETRLTELERAAGSRSSTVTISSRNINRRLERLEAYLALPSDEPALITHLICV
jgi:hypothetical protein